MPSTIIDLTHTITSGMPVYPGTRPVNITVSNTVEKDGFKETDLNILTHTGTHMDCPAHIFKNGKTITDFAPDKFIGNAFVIDCRNLKPNSKIPVSLLQNVQQQLHSVDFILFNTGWDQYWNENRYFSGFPTLDDELADSLASYNLKGIGIDAISIEPVNEKYLNIHHKLLSKDIILVENLTNLQSLAGKTFTFCCFPLKIAEGDGSPVRAIAII
ncbi:MAG: cyclase family protein [Bacteroidales bacterium]|nr:cyclase family protein [Bacteroidales bacterium]